MIRQISCNSVNISDKPQKSEPNFKGLEGIGGAIFNGATWAVQQCEANPMINVAVLDLTTAIVPRTIVEGQTNTYAGFEAFRRESSGLIINCLIPGVIVATLARPLQKLIMGEGSNMSKCWANEETIGLISNHWTEASDIAKNSKGEILFANDSQRALKSKAYNTLHDILAKTAGVDGTEMKSFKVKEFEDSIKDIVNTYINT